MTEEQAIARAKPVAIEQGRLWVEPIEAVLERNRRSGRVVWNVSTNAGGVGYNIYVVIDDQTGEVVKKGENNTR